MKARTVAAEDGERTVTVTVTEYVTVAVVVVVGDGWWRLVLGLGKPQGCCRRQRGVRRRQRWKGRSR